MRVAYLCADPGVPVFGRKGSSVHVQEVVRALLAHGAAVDLFATRFDGQPPADLGAVRCHALPALPKGEPAAREAAALAANAAIAAALRQTGPFDLIYERYSLWCAAGMTTAAEWGSPGLLEVNAPLIEEQAAHRALVHRAQAVNIAERAFGAATALLAVSEGVAGYLAGFPMARGRIHVMPNGVNPTRFPADLTPARPAPPGTLTIGFVGTLKPWHGLSVLVEAVERLQRRRPALRLLIVGDGPERASLEADLKRRGLTAISELTGAVPPEAVPGLIAAMDIAVAPYPPSDDFYFSPLKVFEYMAAGRAVVASRIGQLTALIDDERTGLLCPPGDVAALADALERLGDDAALRARLGRVARTAVLTDFTWTATVGRALGLAGRRPVAPALPAEVGN